MPFYYYLFLSTQLPLIVILSRSYFFRKRNLPAELFSEALRNENNEDFEEALTAYENVLSELNRTGSRSYLKFKSTEKIKVLRSIINYKNSFYCITRVYD
ncbi:MAG TPA: hypothetical protein VET23_00290 [Chitinophagaceae bacterium]|nr:hypothetical protein [Chitinophagaceae bacterium]